MTDRLVRRTFLMAAGLELITLGCNQTPSGHAAVPRGEPSVAAPPKRPPSAPGSREAPEPERGEPDPEAPEPQLPLPRVYLQPLGDQLPRDDVTFIRRALDVFYPLSVSELAPRPLPQSAYYAPRQRYRAEKLLDFLESEAPEDSHVIIGNQRGF